MRRILLLLAVLAGVGCSEDINELTHTRNTLSGERNRIILERAILRESLVYEDDEMPSRVRQSVERICPVDKRTVTMQGMTDTINELSDKIDDYEARINAAAISK